MLNPYFRCKLFLFNFISCISLVNDPTCFAQTDVPKIAEALKTASSTVVDLQVIGAERTRISWITSYLGLSFPTELTAEDCKRFQKKLLTTDVFVSVEVYLKATKSEQYDAPQSILVIELDEKWTTIPVIRGMFGGGTPLAVIGVYNTHAFGSLWTLGAEGRRYGSAPWSGVVWARAPRWGRGKHYLSLELWQLRRVRTFYDEDFAALGEVRTDASTLKATLLHPISDPANSREEPSNLQFGGEISFVQPQKAAYSTGLNASSLGLNNESRSLGASIRILPTLAYDDIEIDGFHHQGIRARIQSGWILGNDSASRVTEIEAFGFAVLPCDIDFALHVFAASTDERRPDNIYFLGGLESIRGLPEGALYGNNAWYSNVELRRLLKGGKRLAIQGAIFSDIGAANFDPKLLRATQQETVGLGLRFSIPRVYRLMLRIDYAWSVRDFGLSSVNIGLGQFFQPYKPL